LAVGRCQMLRNPARAVARLLHYLSLNRRDARCTPSSLP